MPFGFLDTQYIDFPPGVDVQYLRGLQLRSGASFAEVLQQLDARLGAFNSAIDPLTASLVTPTTEPYADDTGATAFEITERGEYTLARPQLAEGGAHMLPIRGYDVSLGFTEDGLERMSMGRIITNVESVLLGFRRLHRLRALHRLFSAAEERVDVRTSATSPGFAGSGTGNNVFTRPFPGGGALPGGYTHYHVANTSNAGEFATALETAVAKLRKWQAGPFDAVGNSATIALLKALGTAGGFTPAGSALVRPSPNDAEALVNPDEYIGVWTSSAGVNVRVREAVDDLTTPHLAIVKSYGALNPANPLAWRWDEQKGRGAYVRYRSLFPLDQAVVLQDFGIGVNNRTAAALIYAAAGADAYVAPTLA